RGGRVHGGQSRRDDPVGDAGQRATRRHPGARIRQGDADAVARPALPAEGARSAVALVRGARYSPDRTGHEEPFDGRVLASAAVKRLPSRFVPQPSNWGAFQAEVRDGRVVGVKPFARDPDPSPLIEAIPQAVHSPNRVAAPMVREGYLARGPESRAGRERERVVAVTWGRALDLVAGELARVKQQHGHAAIMGGSAGWGSAGIFHDARTQTRRFFAALGGFMDQDSNYSFGAALKFLPHVLGSAQSVTGPLT